MKQLILASASPRRSELLSQLGYQFSVHVVDIDESPRASELPGLYLPRMSKSKVLEAARQLSVSLAEPSVVLAADTSVILDDCILGKPEGFEHFKQMMARLSGRWHEVMTSIALVSVVPESSVFEVVEQTVTTRVKFRGLSDSEVAAYWRTTEPSDKAGGYGIQGKAAVFVERIEGSYSNVVGLPLCEVASMLSGAGIQFSEIWTNSLE